MMTFLFRNLNNKFNKVNKINTLFLLQAKHSIFSAKKIFKGKDLAAGTTVEITNENGEVLDQYGTKIKNIKTIIGTYPYFSLDDHPLIPGYSRMIPVTREFLDKWNEIEHSKQLKSVISICKNPEKIEGLQNLSL